MAKNHKRKQVHFSRQQLLREMNKVAMERKVYWQAAWTASSIVAAYALYKNVGFGAKRIQWICAEIDRLNEMYMNGELDIDAIRKHQEDNFHFVVTNNASTEDDIRAKKGSFLHMLGTLYLEPTNNTYEYAARYYTLLFHVMETKHGFKRRRLNRLKRHIMKYLDEYEEGSTNYQVWVDELRDYCGIQFEEPKVM